MVKIPTVTFVETTYRDYLLNVTVPDVTTHRCGVSNYLIDIEICPIPHSKLPVMSWRTRKLYGSLEAEVDNR